MNTNLNTIATTTITAIVTTVATVVDSEWVRRFEDLLLWGFDSVGALGYLDGLKGRVSKPSPAPYWVKSLWVSWSSVSWEEVELDWGRGRISFPEKNRRREMKLGKWLRKAGATVEQIKEFETRQMEEWDWRISASLWDVLTMSHNRAWTSCMRPYGGYQRGVFSDMRAGSAVLFWYRPGASQPCGREILRPGVDDGKPVIIRGGTTYGTGGTLSSDELSSLTGVPVVRGSIRELGGLCHGVYDDFMSQGELLEPEEEEKREDRLIFVWRDRLQQGADCYETFVAPPPPPKPSLGQRPPVLDWREAWNPHAGRRNTPIWRDSEGAWIARWTASERAEDIFTGAPF